MITNYTSHILIGLFKMYFNLMTKTNTQKQICNLNNTTFITINLTLIIQL